MTCGFVHGVPRRARKPEFLNDHEERKPKKQFEKKQLNSLPKSKPLASEENLLHVGAAVCCLPCPRESWRKSRV